MAVFLSILRIEFIKHLCLPIGQSRAVVIIRIRFRFCSYFISKVLSVPLAAHLPGTTSTMSLIQTFHMALNGLPTSGTIGALIVCEWRAFQSTPRKNLCHLRSAAAIQPTAQSLWLQLARHTSVREASKSTCLVWLQQGRHLSSSQ